MPRTYPSTLLRSPRAELQRKRCSRGAVLVEGLIVSMLMMMFVAAVLFTHRLYASKMMTVLQAREGAWLHVLPGCSENSFTNQDLDSFLADQNMDLVEDDAAQPDPAEDDVEGWLSVQEEGADGQSDTLSVSTVAPLTSHTFHVQTSTELSCNERGGQGSHDSRITSLYEFFRQSRWWPSD